jgi:hypothetical protein
MLKLEQVQEFSVGRRYSNSSDHDVEAVFQELLPIVLSRDGTFVAVPAITSYLYIPSTATLVYHKN